jgi:hypothetical protein
MPTIKRVEIEPIHTKSKGGYDVVLTHISPADHDCLGGEINTPGSGLIVGQWNLAGYLRSGTETCNLDMRSGELPGLVELAKQLGATR